jgi:hypothetical protein
MRPYRKKSTQTRDGRVEKEREREYMNIFLKIF